MDADSNQKTTEFVAIARLLKQHSINAPTILAADPINGLVLIEDFGNRNLGHLLDTVDEAKPFYLRATDLLIKLHNVIDPQILTPLNLPTFNHHLFTEQVGLFLDFYVPIMNHHTVTEQERADFNHTWQETLRPIDKLPQTLMLRDFMPDNLMQLNDQSLGVLDFQDGGLGPIAYDVASLCEQVRRDQGAPLFDHIIEHYIATAKPACDQQDFIDACYILSAQRHLRIMGIITKLAHHSGRREKLVFLPRIKNYLKDLLQKPCLKDIRKLVGEL
jgi:aminoglycoside/choline kinase family phosphotransferase